jgi:hypothetical protein
MNIKGLTRDQQAKLDVELDGVRAAVRTNAIEVFKACAEFGALDKAGGFIERRMGAAAVREELNRSGWRKVMGQLS